VPAPLSLSCKLSSRVLPITDGPRLVYLLIDISGGGGGHTLPSNLGFIIDTSDSMRIRLVTDEQFAELARNGQAQEIMTDGVPAYQITSIPNELMTRFPRRIDYVTEALAVASEYLRPVDRFSLVAFAGRAQRVIPFSPGKERSRLSQAAREMEYIQLGDDTKMAEGLALAFDEIQKAPADAFATRLILLTDGHTRNVNDCYDWANQARQSGIKLTTMGIGVEFNEDLLIPLADMTGGNAYYIETPEQIPDAFRNELGAALRISYRNVEVKLLLSGGVELRRVYRALPDLSNFDPGPNMEGSYALLVGDYDPAAPVALLAELIVPPTQEGAFRLGQVMLAWDDPSGEQSRQNAREEIVAQFSNKITAPLNERVMNIVEKVGAFKMGTLALDAAQTASKSGDPNEKGAATLRLRQAATRLLDLGEHDIADTMLQQADGLENRGSLDPEATKKLRYETRRMSQRL
jgi:Ca-activated chloride channel family protein